MTAQATVVTGSSTMGSLVGGTLIGWVGAQVAITAAGVVVLVVSSIVLVSSVAASVRRTTGSPAEPTFDRCQSIRV